MIDTADTSKDCMQNLIQHSDQFAVVWKLDKGFDPLQKWLDKFNIGETAEQLTDYDFTCEPIHTDDTP
ncbi:hypothetical protein ISREJYDI_CDS0004 [Pseudomonas phage UNO-G1W1]|uniref:Uncharacterized protein n=1 Tax=Pseudomonas phage UNO-G1W1 TaxID=3136609 RepID=A0AAX4MW09_9CAUD